MSRIITWRWAKFGLRLCQFWYISIFQLSYYPPKGDVTINNILICSKWYGKFLWYLWHIRIWSIDVFSEICPSLVQGIGKVHVLKNRYFYQRRLLCFSFLLYVYLPNNYLIYSKICRNVRYDRCFAIEVVTTYQSLEEIKIDVFCGICPPLPGSSV